MSKFCPRCGKPLGKLESLTSGSHGRCRDCNRVVRQQLQDWRIRFLGASADGLLTPGEWQSLQYELTACGIVQDEAAEFIRKDALGFVERAFAFAKADGQLEEEEEGPIRWLVQELRLNSAAPYILEEVEYLSRLRNIRQGRIPTVTPSVVLTADELCYLDAPATYQKVNRASTTLVPGRLVVTNRKILFTAPTGGGEVPLNKVLNVRWHPTGIFLELSRQANNGFYSMLRPEMTAETVLAAVRLSNRQLIAGGERDTRRIPQHIKTVTAHLSVR